MLASSTDVERVPGHFLLEPDGKAAKAGRKALEDPEDLRALARVLRRSGPSTDRNRAIEVLESLVGRDLASSRRPVLAGSLRGRERGLAQSSGKCIAI